MNLDDVDFNLSFNNFDPNDIQVDQTINAVFVVDISPSIASYVQHLNDAFSDFVGSMQRSHVADRLMVSVIEFSEKVRIKSGFQPISQVSKHTFTPTGSGTALYDATMQGLKIAINYRQNLEASGVNAKTLIFVITDGEDNSSTLSPKFVKAEIDSILAEERNVFSFTSVLFGVGSAASFEKAQKNMGIQHLAKVGVSGEEIKKMIGFISQSISSAANNQQINF